MGPINKRTRTADARRGMNPAPCPAGAAPRARPGTAGAPTVWTVRTPRTHHSLPAVAVAALHRRAPHLAPPRVAPAMRPQAPETSISG